MKEYQHLIGKIIIAVAIIVDEQEDISLSL